MATKINQPAKFWIVRVRDAFCGARGHVVEECITLSKKQADDCFKKWAAEWPCDRGFRVSCKAHAYSTIAWEAARAHLKGN